MIYAIVGHRGVGKSSFLLRAKRYFDLRMQTCHVFDLDSEIEQRTGQTISEIFENQGENYFRKVEQAAFNDLLQDVSEVGGVKFIALGAGFDGAIPGNVRVLWLRRPTDRLGRIFADRPRLEKSISPLAEFMQRYDVRDKHYRKICHKEIVMSEGWDFVNNFEPYLLGLKPASIGGCITILPEHIANPARFQLFLEEFSILGVNYFELRDDLHSEEAIKEIAQRIPASKVLISFRMPDVTKSFIKWASDYMTDWACELGPSQLAHNKIASLHTLWPDESIDEATERLLQQKAEHYKLAVPVYEFMQLWAGHRFFTESPNNRSFLPISQNGRWQWYRALHGQNMKFNFIRSGDGSAPDQPQLFDYLRVPKRAESFAAVLGDPVGHSRTPAEQSEFFLERNMATFSIQMNEFECDSLNLSVLQRLGMKAAAVTAPLKKKIMDVCTFVDKKATDLNAVNTIVSTASGWQGTNTDVNGVETMFSVIEMPEEVAVWGGGGTRQVLKSLLPNARFFSARRGEEIWVEKQVEAAPEVVVWALGRTRMGTSKNPPENWRPRYVMDLNYTENSPGLEYALEVGAKYISGKAVFKTQARVQREFWAKGNL